MMLGRSYSSTRLCLYYHGISDHQVDRFQRQMKWLQSHMKIIPARDIISSLDNNRLVCITFDDAIDSVRRNAIPILQKRNIPATIFAVSGNLGRQPLWSMPADDPDAKEDVMSAGQLCALPESLIEIGSHTVSHPDLRSLSTNDLRKELMDSKQSLESILGRDINLFSVPYGLYHEEVLQIASRAGYEQVFTSDPLMIHENSSAMGIGRFSVSPDNWMIEFRLKAMGAYRWRRIVQKWKQRRSTGVV